MSRTLQLGASLKPADGSGGFVLDLSSPTAHKTAAVFGPVVTTVPAPAASLLTAWLVASGRSTTGKYVWGNVDGSAQLAAPRWTELVKRVFKRHAGVPLAPKELRSSCICWLRSESNSDAVLKSAAFAMRHTTKQQAGPAYDRERAERLSQAAINAVGEHAARFA